MYSVADRFLSDCSLVRMLIGAQTKQQKGFKKGKGEDSRQRHLLGRKTDGRHT